MPTLDWIGKQAVVDHHRKVPYHLLHCDKSLSVGDPEAGNLLVQGDNLLALKALLPYYAGKVKCIYIDPPYNTGNENWVYNDNVNSPEIRDWLNKTVGKEAEDLCRHDKWLCMMYPRLSLLHEFLTEDGAILVSLDDNEHPYLRMILDDLYGRPSFVGTIVWNTRNTDNRVKTNLSPDHEYIIVYGRLPGAAILGRLIDRSNFKNPDNDPRGPYVTDPLTGKATLLERPNLHAYNMQQPGTTNIWKPEQAKGWITDEAGYQALLKDDRIWWPPDPKSGKPRKKRFLTETQARMPASSFWGEFRAFSGARELDDILDERVFAFPKPVDLVRKIIDHCAPPNSIVMDSFAGSGTTGHAVLAQNAADGGKRRFILIEMDEAICRDVTAQRLTRVIGGRAAGANGGASGDDSQLAPGESPGAKSKGAAKPIEPLGGGFRFCTLAKPLFDATGAISAEVKFADLAAHVFFTETGNPIPKRATGKTPFIGAFNGVGYYLLFNGVMGDRSVSGGNVLTSKTLATLPEHDGPRVIYGESCRLGPERLKRLGITFRQLPYEVKVS